jgi:hypothetical protein
MNSTEYLLKLVDWQLFLTLTFSDENVSSVYVRERKVRKFLRALAKRQQVTLADLPTAIRWERGEKTERPHCHVLLTGLPKPPTISLCFILMKHWEKRGGIARVRLWEASLREEAAAYLTKGMDGEKPVIGEYSSGNEYEMVKFHSADRLVLNEAVWELIQKKTQTSFEVAPVR